MRIVTLFGILLIGTLLKKKKKTVKMTVYLETKGINLFLIAKDRTPSSRFEAFSSDAGVTHVGLI